MTTVLLYHVTSRESAQAIIREGFRDGRLSFGDGVGVSLLGHPTDATPGDGVCAIGAVIEVEVPGALAREHEILEEVGETDVDADDSAGVWGVVHWLMPAAIINDLPRRLLTALEAEDLAAQPAPPPIFRDDMD